MRASIAVLCLLLACTASAQQYPGAQAAGGAVSDGGFPADPYYVASPDQIIRQGIDRLVGFLMGSGNPDPQTVRNFVELELAPHFDFAYMARWAAGPLFHRLSPQHRAALATRLRLLFLDALARHLGTVDRPLPRVDVFPARPGRTISEAVVYSRVLSERRPPVRLEFRFYWSNQGWKVYDAVANGASAVAFFRSYFTRELRRHGPDVVLR
jgi:phospholipid transport system substrate-binding protein